jgi:hypothetical protein
MDSEVRTNGEGRLFVPHIIRLKMQWDKFSSDSEESLRKLEHELLTAAVDHINDHRYYTFAPLQIDVKPDYFTSGVKLLVSFGAEGDALDAEMNVTMPGQGLTASQEETKVRRSFRVAFRYTASGEFSQKELSFEEGKRLSVGRTKENDLALNEAGVSKFHASLLVNSDGQLVVADIGSTNGTFVNGERIAYGKAVPVGREGVLAFGTVEVQFAVHLLQPANEEEKNGSSEKFVVGDMEFSRKPAVGQDTEDGPHNVPESA